MAPATRPPARLGCPFQVGFTGADETGKPKRPPACADGPPGENRPATPVSEPPRPGTSGHAQPGAFPDYLKGRKRKADTTDNPRITGVVPEPHEDAWP